MIRVVDDAGMIRVRFEILNTGKTFAGLVKRMVKLFVQGVAIERQRPVVEALLDAELRVVVITPRQVKGLRSRYSGSGAKSDACEQRLHLVGREHLGSWLGHLRRVDIDHRRDVKFALEDTPGEELPAAGVVAV